MSKLTDLLDKATELETELYDIEQQIIDEQYKLAKSVTAKETDDGIILTNTQGRSIIVKKVENTFGTFRIWEYFNGKKQQLINNAFNGQTTRIKIKLAEGEI